MVKMINNKKYKVNKEWGKDWTASCGSHGIVLSKKGTYRTAFFEIYPKNPDTFIRGEGETIEEAEEKAWEKWIKIKECKNHEFERRNYTNGVGFCKHCNLLKSDAFEPLTKCVICGKPTYWTYDKDNNYYCKKHSKQIPYENLTDYMQKEYNLLKKDTITTLKEIEEYQFEECYIEEYKDNIPYLMEFIKGMFNKVSENNKINDISEKAYFILRNDDISLQLFLFEHSFKEIISFKKDCVELFALKLGEMEDISEENEKEKKYKKTGRDIYVFTIDTKFIKNMKKENNLW